MAIVVKYKDEVIANVDTNETKTLLTSNRYCEGNIRIENGNNDATVKYNGAKLVDITPNTTKILLTGGKLCDYDFEVENKGSSVEIVSWAEGTDAQILAMVNALDAGIITIEDTGWQIGDTRTVVLSAMSATGVNESHASQSVEFVLMDSTLTGMTPADSSKPLHFAVGMKGSLDEEGYMNATATTSGGWNSCSRRTWCNNVFANSLPQDFKSCFRQFKWLLASGGATTSGLTESTDLFAFSAEKQVIGQATNSHNDEANQFNHWEWYQTASNRSKIRDGSAHSWWTASPANNHATNYVYFNSSGSSTTYSAGNNRGISPFGCI